MGSEESQMSVILEGREEQEAYQMLLTCSSVPVDSLPFAAEICTNSTVTPAFSIVKGKRLWPLLISECLKMT